VNKSPTIPAATRIRKQTPSLNKKHIKTHHTAAPPHIKTTTTIIKTTAALADNLRSIATCNNTRNPHNQQPNNHKQHTPPPHQQHSLVSSIDIRVARKKKLQTRQITSLSCLVNTKIIPAATRIKKQTPSLNNKKIKTHHIKAPCTSTQQTQKTH
jgi:hypothetical protein